MKRRTSAEEEEIRMRVEVHRQRMRERYIEDQQYLEREGIMVYPHNPEKLDLSDNLLICSSISNILHKPILQVFFDFVDTLQVSNQPISSSGRSLYPSDPISINNTITIDRPPTHPGVVDIDGYFGSQRVERILGNRQYDKIMFLFCDHDIYLVYEEHESDIPEDIRHIWSCVNTHLRPNGIVVLFEITDQLLNYLESRYGIVYETSQKVVSFTKVHVLRKI